VKGKMMPTQTGSNIEAGQKETLAGTTKEKSHALLNRRRQRGVINRGITIT
jgi:hypothetical protein